jgi:hypothetical protein
MHSNGRRQRTAKNLARQWPKTAHGNDLKHGNSAGHCRALPFVVRAARTHGNATFAVRSSLCRALYGNFLCFPFYFILFNTYIYVFN